MLRTTSSPLANKTVLIIDDNPDVRRTLRGVFKEMGVGTICEAVDGRQALEKVERTRYDFITSDIDMPYMNGIDFLRAFRRQKAFITIPVVMISGGQSEVVVQQVMRYGVRAFLPKPVDVNALRELAMGILQTPSRGDPAPASEIATLHA